MYDLESIIKDLDANTKKTILGFVSMCDDLESLISRENTLLLDKGTVAFDGMFTRKINMLSKFEKDIRNVLSLIKERYPENIGLQKTLVNRIQEVRRVLSINTTFQLRDLKSRTKRMAALKDTLIDFSKHDVDFSEHNRKGDTACH